VGDFTETLQAAPGEAAFFETPLDPETLINEILTTPPSVFFTDTGSTTSATWITGGSAVISFDVPEPATFSLLGAALAGLLGLRGRAGKNV
jgi:hypothetical protein